MLPVSEHWIEIFLTFHRKCARIFIFIYDPLFGSTRLIWINFNREKPCATCSIEITYWLLFNFFLFLHSWSLFMNWRLSMSAPLACTRRSDDWNEKHGVRIMNRKRPSAWNSYWSCDLWTRVFCLFAYIITYAMHPQWIISSFHYEYCYSTRCHNSRQTLGSPSTHRHTHNTHAYT